MRSTADVIKAVLDDEPCTEEELRLCIVSMQHTVSLIDMDLARWAARDEASHKVPPGVSLKAECHWKSIHENWHHPLDKRIPPENRPGHPDQVRRRKIAQKIWNKALKKVEGDNDV